MDEKKAKELTDSIFDKLNDQERVYLAWVHNQKNKEIERLNNEIKQYKEYIKELKDSLRNYHIKNNKLINKNEEKDKEIERLNNILKDIKSQLDYLETYSSKEDVFEDMRRRLDRIESIVNRK